MFESRIKASTVTPLSSVNERPGAQGPSKSLLEFTKARFIRLRFQRLQTLAIDQAILGNRLTTFATTRQYRKAIQRFCLSRCRQTHGCKIFLRYRMSRKPLHVVALSLVENVKISGCIFNQYIWKCDGYRLLVPHTVRIERRNSNCFVQSIAYFFDHYITLFHVGSRGVKTKTSKPKSQKTIFHISDYREPFSIYSIYRYFF